MLSGAMLMYPSRKIRTYPQLLIDANRATDFVVGPIDDLMLTSWARSSVGRAMPF